MGWFDTLINIGDFALSYQSVSKLGELVKQGQEIEVDILKEIKEIIFKYKSSAKKIVASKEKNQFISAIALNFLNKKFEDLAITSEIFPDFSDKEYVDDTKEYLLKESKILLEEIDFKKRDEAIRCTNLLFVYFELDFYLNNFYEIRPLLDAVLKLERKDAGLSVSRLELYEAERLFVLYKDMFDMDLIKRIDTEVNQSFPEAEHKLEITKKEIEAILGESIDFISSNLIAAKTQIKKSTLTVKFLNFFLGFLDNSIKFFINIDNVDIDRIFMGEEKTIVLTPGIHDITISSSNLLRTTKLKVKKINFCENTNITLEIGYNKMGVFVWKE